MGRGRGGEGEGGEGEGGLRVFKFCCFATRLC